MNKYDPEDDPATRFAKRMTEKKADDDEFKLTPSVVAITLGIIAVLGLIVWMVISLVLR
jgi:preprotein translocase subunit Sss1